MKFGILPPVSAGVCGDPEWMRGFAQHAEACGFESIVVVEHAVVIGSYESRYPYSTSGRMPLPDDCPIPDPLDLLAFLAAATSTIGLATGVVVLPNHHPVVLAKRVATVDTLSGGRLRLVVGVGWMREEVEACGADFATRGRRVDESIDAMRALWEAGPEGASFQSPRFAFADAHCHPKPVRGTVPIHIGGHSIAAARRAGRRGDGFQPLGVAGEELQELVAEMRAEANAAGRDPDALELTVGGMVARTDPETVATAELAGANRMVLSPTSGSDLAQVCDELSAFSARMNLA